MIDLQQHQQEVENSYNFIFFLLIGFYYNSSFQIETRSGLSFNGLALIVSVLLLLSWL